MRFFFFCVFVRISTHQKKHKREVQCPVLNSTLWPLSFGKSSSSRKVFIDSINALLMFWFLPAGARFTVVTLLLLCIVLAVVLQLHLLCLCSSFVLHGFQWQCSHFVSGPALARTAVGIWVDLGFHLTGQILSFNLRAAVVQRWSRHLK